jgi:hypothetical protein
VEELASPNDEIDIKTIPTPIKQLIKNNIGDLRTIMDKIN